MERPANGLPEDLREHARLMCDIIAIAFQTNKTRVASLMPEGDGTVLDHSCLMFLSNMWIGRKHDNFRLPLVLAGGLVLLR